LRYLNLGETIMVETTTGQSHLYRIVGMDVVDSRKGSLLLDTEIPMLSLVTCYPFNTDESGGPLRFVVTAKMLL
jgi:sortase A